MPTFSSNLEASLHRALALANDQKHVYSTLEHLLLSLTDDPDATEVLLACKCNLPKLREDIQNYLDSASDELSSNGKQEEDSKPTAGFQRVIQRAVIHVQSAGREEITGANVLVAIFAERESHAAHFLEVQDITRYDVVQLINQGVASAPVDLRPKQRAIVIEGSIARSAQSAPQFQTFKGKIRFRPSPARGRVVERKAAALERCNELQRRCARRANEQPELSKLVDKYAIALSTLRKNRGAYGLFLSVWKLKRSLKQRLTHPLILIEISRWTLSYCLLRDR